MTVALSTVGQVCEVDSGPAFKSAHFADVGQGTPLLRGENIEPGSLRWTKTRTWPDEMMGGYEHLLVEPGDLILGMDRPVVSAGLKLARVRPRDCPALLVQRVARIRAHDIDARYLYLWLSSQAFVNHLQSKATGTQLPHVTLRSIRDFPVPRFGTVEEARIVEILEDHTSRLDAASRYIHQAAQRRRRLFEAAVLALFREAHAGGTTLGQIAEWGSGGTPPARTIAYYDGGDIPWVNSGDLDDGPVIDAPRKITQLGLERSSAKWVPAGSVLVAMYGATIGRTGLTVAPVTTNQAIAFAIPSEGVSAPWLQWYLRSQSPKLRRAGKGGAQPNISQGILKDWPVAVPHLAMQEAQARAAADLDQELSRLDAALEAAVHRAAVLRRSLLTAAFSGRLSGRLGEVDREAIPEHVETEL